MKILVTGGGGFLGKAIVTALRARGDQVRSFSRGAYPELAALGVEHVRGDLGDKAAVWAAAKGCGLVFHTAALPGIWGPKARFDRTNVVGTENVISACRAHGIARLVYTSSPSVVFGGFDLAGIDESQPYAKRYLAHYPRTKAIAERMVRAANDETLATVSLRPHLIWGPGDRHILPRLVERARAGKLRQVGLADKLVDTIYVDNAVEAHLLAADKLAPGSSIAGKVYFLSNGDPQPCWQLIGRFLDAVGAPPVGRPVPYRLAWVAGALLEGGYGLLGRQSEPPMTRFVAEQFAHAHWFDIGAARRDLGWSPRVSIDEGIERLRALASAWPEDPSPWPSPRKTGERG